WRASINTAKRIWRPTLPSLGASGQSKTQAISLRCAILPSTTPLRATLLEEVVEAFFCVLGLIGFVLAEDGKLFAEVVFGAVGDVVGAGNEAVVRFSGAIVFAVFARVEVCMADLTLSSKRDLFGA